MRSRRLFRRARVEASARSLVLAVDASEDAVERFLDGLKYDDKGLVAAIAQDVDTGAISCRGSRAERRWRTRFETVRRRFGAGVDRNCGAKERRVGTLSEWRACTWTAIGIV